MPNLTYSVPDFLPYTIAASASVNARFNDIKTLLNTTGLTSSNVQQYGLTRDRLAQTTANAVVINDSGGTLSAETQLAPSRGGLGFSPTFASNAGAAIIVDPTNSFFQLGNPTIGKITEALASDVNTITAGEAITLNNAVCLDINESSYKVFNTNSSTPNRRINFLGFATASATVTPQNISWLNVGALVTSNVVSYTINGRSYSTTFASSSAATMSAIATQIATDPDIQSAALQGGNLQINIVGKGALTIDISTPLVTGGSSQTTISVTTTQPPVGDAVQIRCFGPKTGFSGLTFGAIYYLSNSNGAITNTPTDTNPVQVGQALSSTVLFVNSNFANFQFSSPTSFITTMGSSSNAAASSNLTNHFNYVSWSSGVNAPASRTYGGIGEASLASNMFFLDGQNTSGTVGVFFAAYNKTAWTTLGNRGTATTQAGVGSLGTVFYVGKGQLSGGSASSSLDAWNGSTWSNGVGTFSAGLFACAALVRPSVMSFVGGRAGGGGSYSNAHETWNGSSIGSATSFPQSQAVGAGIKTTSNKVIAAAINQDTTFSYVWDGASWSSSITMAASQCHDENGTPCGSGYNSTNQLSAIVGGTNSGNTAITTAQVFNGATWATTTVLPVARQSGMGAAI